MFSSLPDQTREDITRAAQTQVRNIHYGKIRLTLGLEDRLQVKVQVKVEDREEEGVEVNILMAKNQQRSETSSATILPRTIGDKYSSIARDC